METLTTALMLEALFRKTLDVQALTFWLESVQILILARGRLTSLRSQAIVGFAKVGPLLNFAIFLNLIIVLPILSQENKQLSTYILHSKISSQIQCIMTKKINYIGWLD